MARSARNGEAPQAQAPKVPSLIRGRGRYEHIHVRAHRGHLLVESREADGARAVARLTPLASGLFGASFCRHDGEWEKMPIVGPVEKVVDDLVDMLAAYIELMDFPDAIRGTQH